MALRTQGPYPAQQDLVRRSIAHLLRGHVSHPRMRAWRLQRIATEGLTGGVRTARCVGLVRRTAREPEKDRRGDPEATRRARTVSDASGFGRGWHARRDTPLDRLAACTAARERQLALPGGRSIRFSPQVRTPGAPPIASTPTVRLGHRYP